MAECLARLINGDRLKGFRLSNLERTVKSEIIEILKSYDGFN